MPMTADGFCGKDEQRRSVVLGAMLPRPAKTAINYNVINNAISAGS